MRSSDRWSKSGNMCLCPFVLRRHASGQVTGAPHRVICVCLLFNSLCVNALFVWRVASGQVTGGLHQVIYVCVSPISLCVNAPLCASGQILQLCLCFYELPRVKSLQVKWIKFQLSATNVVKFNKSNVLLEIMAQCMGND